MKGIKFLMAGILVGALTCAGVQDGFGKRPSSAKHGGTTKTTTKNRTSNATASLPTSGPFVGEYQYNNVEDEYSVSVNLNLYGKTISGEYGGKCYGTLEFANMRHIFSYDITKIYSMDDNEAVVGIKGDLNPKAVIKITIIKDGKGGLLLKENSKDGPDLFDNVRVF